MVEMRVFIVVGHSMSGPSATPFECYEHTAVLLLECLASYACVTAFGATEFDMLRRQYEMAIMHEAAMAAAAAVAGG